MPACGRLWRRGWQAPQWALQGSSMLIARCLMLTEPPSIDANEITDKGYLNQRAVLAKRAALVDSCMAGRRRRRHRDRLKERMDELATRRPSPTRTPGSLAARARHSPTTTARCASFCDRSRHQGGARGLQATGRPGQDRRRSGRLGGADELRCLLSGAPHRPLCGRAIGVPALLVQRLCTSGFEAILQAADQLALGKSKAVLCVGTSPCRATRSPPIRTAADSRWGRSSSRTSCGRRRSIPRRSRAWATPPRSSPSATRSRARIPTPSPPRSFERAMPAREAGFFKDEVVPVTGERFERAGYATREIRLPRKWRPSTPTTSAADADGGAEGAQARFQGRADRRQQLGHRRRRRRGEW